MAYIAPILNIAVWPLLDIWRAGKFLRFKRSEAVFDRPGSRISLRLSGGAIELPLDGGVRYVEGLARIGF